MKLELQQRLFAAYPRFFRKPGLRLVRTLDPVRVDAHTPDGLLSLAVAGKDAGEPYLNDDRGPIDAWGIECGDGWYSIIDRLAAACEAEIAGLAKRPGVAREEWPRAVQIKEKFGTLRFCVAGEALLSDALCIQIGQAELDSAGVCEQCGQPGALRQKPGIWIHVACDACEVDIKQRSEQEFDPDEYKKWEAALRALLDSRPE